MLLIIVVCLRLALARKSYITLEDHDFVGEDEQLAANLAKRMPQPADIQPGAARGKHDRKLLELELENDFEYQYGYLKNISKSARRNFQNDPNDKDLKSTTLKMQRQALYSAQLRYDELRTNVLVKYEKHPYFRISYIFHKLDEWRDDIHALYTVVKNLTGKHIAVYDPVRKFRVLRFIYYYEHCVRINVDVTYTIEHLLEYHHRVMNETKMLDGDTGNEPQY